MPAANIEIPYRATAVVRYQYEGITNTYARYQSDGRTFNREVDAAAATGAAAVFREPVARQPADLSARIKPEAAAARPEHDRRRHRWAARKRRPARMGVQWRRGERGGG